MEKIIEFLESKKTYKKVYKIINESLKKAGNNGMIGLCSPLEGGVEQPQPNGDPLSMYNQQIDKENELFLCGGAIANTLYYLYHKTEKPIINDVDFFVIKSAFKQINGDFSDLFTKNGVSKSVNSEDGYDYMYQQEGGHRYHIIDEKKDKLINWVGVSVENYDDDIFKEPNKKKPKTNKDIVLGGFDLNCTQVGLDLSEGKIVYEQGFVEFLKTKQMIVTAPHTPTQTLIRIFKKVEELGCYCDIELESRFLLGAFFCDGVKHTVGEVTYEKYLKYKDKIDEHLSLVKLTTNDIKQYINKLVSTNNKSIEERHISKFCRDFLGFTKYLDYYNGEDLNNLMEEDGLDLKNLWMCLPKREIDLKVMVNNKELRTYKAYFNLMNRGVRELHKKKLGWFMGGTKETNIYGYKVDMVLYKETLLKELGLTLGFRDVELIDNINPLVFTLKKYGLEFISCDFTKKHVDEVSNFIKQHSSVWYTLPKKNFQYCYGEIKKLISYAKKEGDWVIGEFENYRYKQDMFSGLSINKDEKLVDPYSFENFKFMVEKKKKQLSEPLVEPISLEGFDYINNVTELVTPLELKNEGKTMGHCVGGYSDTIKNGNSRIFHIDFDGISSTLQISYKPKWVNPYLGERSNERYYEIQHYGEYPIKKGNVTPNVKNIKIAKKLCKFLTKKYLQKKPKEVTY